MHYFITFDPHPPPPSPHKALLATTDSPSILPENLVIPQILQPLPPLPPPSQGENTDWSQSKAFIYRGDSPSNFWLTIQQLFEGLFLFQIVIIV